MHKLSAFSKESHTCLLYTSLNDPVPFLGAVLIQLNALLLKFGLLVIICLFLGVLKCLSGILQIS